MSTTPTPGSEKPDHSDSLAAYDQDAQRLLVHLLREAGRLEHCLLNTYLVAACSVKCRPEEFATLPGAGGRPVENLRRAVHFEFARDWKQDILSVAREEMLHLHYVNCLLRALGERPEFGLPERDPSGGWVIPDWQPDIGGTPQPGVSIPLAPLSPTTARHFVLFESTDSLQTSNPFSPEVLKQFESMRAWELRFRIAEILWNQRGTSTDSAESIALRDRLFAVYDSLAPAPDAPAGILEAAARAATPEELSPPRFRSIADLYNQSILPLFQQAFDFGWVKHNNRDLANELQDPAHAAEGFLPVAPVYRGQNFQALFTKNISEPLRNYRHVRDIIREIVEEGEGFASFSETLDDLLKLDPAQYLASLQASPTSRRPGGPPRAPSGVDRFEKLRQSHLYRFAHALADLDHEVQVCQKAGLSFFIQRTPVPLEGHPGLRELASELPAQFNAAYLVVCAWLSRIYEIPYWLGDKSRREAIEMVASWPLMSLAVRPFLELASFFGEGIWKQLFRQDAAGLPDSPAHARQLLQLFQGSARSEAINERMDYLAVRVLEDVASWAREQLPVASASIADPVAQEIICARLQCLSVLREFKAQFPFRVHGGYSSQSPDLAYTQAHPDGDRFDENPAMVGPSPDSPAIFNRTLLLRLRFVGWGRAQLATDPEPPTEEVGCTGTHMLHASDAPAYLDRSLYWQTDSGAIQRGPANETGAAIPGIGVHGVEASLLVTDTAKVSYSTLGVLNSTGAVQASGTQLDLSISGLHDLLNLSAVDITGSPERKVRVNLRSRPDGRRPYFVGENHLVYHDGEPIDPFIFSIACDGDADSSLSRSVFNEGRALIDFSPIQRIGSQRGPIGFDSVRNLPPWTSANLPEPLRSGLASPKYPASYLLSRANLLTAGLPAQLGALKSQSDVDALVSAAERARLVNIPRATTVAWLNYTLHYAHTLSGPLSLPEDSGSRSSLLRAFSQVTHLPLRFANPLAGGDSRDRQKPNARWLVRYTAGVMDTDALANLVYGDVYIPLTLSLDANGGTKPVQLAKRWTFAPGTRDAVAAVTLDFATPFWATYTVASNRQQRNLLLPSGQLWVEDLTTAGADSYAYSGSGLPGLTRYQARFALSVSPAGVVELAWSVEFTGGTNDAILDAVLFFTRQAESMQSALQSRFTPKLIG